MNFERKWCHECSGIQLFGEHKGKACCSIMSRILKNSETGEPIRAYMDKETTRNMCRNLGEAARSSRWQRQQRHNAARRYTWRP